MEQIFKYPKQMLEDYYKSTNQNHILQSYESEIINIGKNIERYTN